MEMLRAVLMAGGLLSQFFVPGALPAPVYVTGNECPADPITPYTRQYYVTPAVACVFDPASRNLRGTDAEARTYLDGGPEIWGDGWTSLGQTPAGVTITQTARNGGTFTISAEFAAQYGQFAFGIKSGALPRWAIFLLPAGTRSGDWGMARPRLAAPRKIRAVFNELDPELEWLVFGR